MKKTCLLFTALLLIPSVLALQNPALEETDFQIGKTEKENKIITYISTTKNVRALNVKITTQTKEFKITPDQKEIPFITGNGTERRIWEIPEEVPEDYDFSNAFEVKSWDNTTRLELDPVPEQTNQKTIEISGKTDPAVECGQTGKCRTTVLVNGEELGEANEDGSFKFDHELSEGENQLEIVAEDPGGNQNTQKKTVSYSIPLYEKYKWFIVGGFIVFIAGFLLLVTTGGLYSLKKKMTKEVGEVKKTELKKLFKKEKKLLDQYQKSGGMKVNMEELKEVWEEIIEEKPGMQEYIQKQAKEVMAEENPKKEFKRRKKKWKKKLHEIDPELKKRSGGVKKTMLDNYVTVLEDKVKEEIKKRK